MKTNGTERIEHEAQQFFRRYRPSSSERWRFLKCDGCAQVVRVKGGGDLRAHTCPHGELCRGPELMAPCCRRLLAAQQLQPDHQDYDVVWNGQIYRLTGLQPSDVARATT